MVSIHSDSTIGMLCKGGTVMRLDERERITILGIEVVLFGATTKGR